MHNNLILARVQEHNKTTLFFRKAWQMFAESIGNTAKLFFAVSCQSAEEFAEGHCCDSRALLNLAIMGESAHNGVHYFLKEYYNFHAIQLLRKRVS